MTSTNPKTKIEKCKFLTFRKKLYTILSTLFLAAFAVIIINANGSNQFFSSYITEITISFAILVFSCVQFEIQHKKSEMDLFNDYNKKYDELNDDLAILTSKKDRKHDTKNKIKKKDKSLIIDYLNLCAEEYYWRNQGYISDELWKYWEIGIRSKLKEFMNNIKVIDVIKNELKEGDSYYGFFDSKLFKETFCNIEKSN